MKAKSEIRCVSDCYTGNLRDFFFGKSNKYLKQELIQLLNNNSFRNPAIIIGDSGTGKTHLVNCLEADLTKKGHIVNRNDCEYCLNQLLEYAREGLNCAEELFKRNCDCNILIIDNIETLNGRSCTQMEFGKFLKKMIQKKKVVILLGTGEEFDYFELLRGIGYGKVLPQVFTLKSLAFFERFLYILRFFLKGRMLISIKTAISIAKNENMGSVIGAINHELFTHKSVKLGGKK